MISAANSGGGNTDGSQFFIVDKDSFPTHLDGYDTNGDRKDCTSAACHTIFAKVVGGTLDGSTAPGLDVVDEISKVEAAGQSSSEPVYPVTLTVAYMK
jgi:cyclophilin family peptidyl-prolyl cis-trans isomerase